MTEEIGNAPSVPDDAELTELVLDLDTNQTAPELCIRAADAITALRGKISRQPLALSNAVQAGFDIWAGKPHNKKWVRRIDGTPIQNDLVVCIQAAVFAALQGGDQ